MRSNTGFTLIELLVAVTITLLLAGVMLSVTTGTLNIWRRTQDTFAANAQSKLALDMLERDLQTATYRKDGLGVTWLAVDLFNSTAPLVNHGWLPATMMKPATADSLNVLPAGASPSIADARFGVSGAWLRFIGTNVEANGSLPVAISYQIARRPLTGTNISPTNLSETRYSLFRSAISNDRTFATGNDVTALGYNSSSQNPAGTRTPTTLTNPHPSDALATNVVDFGVWLYVRNVDGSLRQIFPSGVGDLTHAATDAAAPGDPNKFPEVADVMIRILTDEGARQLDAMESGNGGVTRPATYATDALWWWAVVEANSHTYTRRIAIKGTAP